MKADFFSQVPRDLGRNLRYRIELRKRAQGDAGFRRAMLTACKHDILFFFAAWCWLYEPRPRKTEDGITLPNIIPFIPWEHQIPIIREIDEHLGFRDIGMEKSRGEGASWIAILFSLHRWLFRQMSAIGLVSRTENAVDNPDDPDSLMWKSLAVGTKVLTPTGWVTIESLKEGDLVIGSSGNPVAVKKSLPTYVGDMVRVTFSDGSTIECTEDHIWSVSSCKSRMGGGRKRTYHKYENKTAIEIASNLRDSVQSRSVHWNWQLPPTPGVEFAEASLPIPPYTLGVLLGDGSLSKTGIEFATVDGEIVDQVRQELGSPWQVKKTGKCSWIVSQGNNGGRSPNPISVALTLLGLRGLTAPRKFIPKEYRFAARSQRIALLQGLMDTDGSLIKKCGLAYFSTTSKRLADDVRELVLSLGGSAGVKSYARKYRHKGEKRDGLLEYRVRVHIADVVPFRLSRKALLYRPRKHTTSRRIVSVERTGHGLAKCISVGSEDGLFVVDSYILTHNCDWELEQLPKWMGGVKDKDFKRTLSDHTLKNLRNGSTITGYAATGDVASGGRKLFFLADELAKFPRGPDREAMASTQHVTDSRFVVSTPKGSEGAYYELMHEPSNMVKLVLDWQMNPTRNRGLYTFVDGVPVAVDPVNNPLPDNYNPPTKKILDLFSRLRRKGFVLERRKRSPWYDRECDRPGATPQNIAQELDRDYGGSAYRFFGDEFFHAAEKTVLQPVSRGVVTYHPETLEPEFQTTRDGPVQLWCNLDVQNSPPESTYVVGADISSGLGGSYTSNSVVEVVDVLTMEQVMEYAINTVSPTEFAEHCVAIAKWFHDAYLIWEANGPGAAFTNRAKALSYPNVYYRSVLWRRGSKKTKEMGWWSDTRTRQALFGEVRRRVAAGTLKLRSDSLVKECQQYQVVADQIIHTGAAKTLDDSSRGQAHGDRVIAMGVCLHGVADRPLTKVKADEVRRTKIPYGSMAWRQQEYEESLRAKDDPWDARSNWDLALRR